MQASDVNVVHLESNEQPSAFEKGQVDGAVTFDPYRAQFLRAGAKTLFDSTQIPGEIVDLLAVRATRHRQAAQRPSRRCLPAGSSAIDYMKREPEDAARRMGIRQQTTGEQFLEAQQGLHIPSRDENLKMLGGATPELAVDRTPADGVDGRREVAAHRTGNRSVCLRRGRWRTCQISPAVDGPMTIRVPASLKLTVPLILLGFAATLSTVNLLYHVPQAERAAEEDSRKRLAQEMSRLQSTLEYLLLKGDMDAAQHEIAVLAHNHDVTFAALTDDRNVVIAATRRAWLGRQIADVLPQFDLEQAARRHSRTARWNDHRLEWQRIARPRRHSDGR